MLSEMRYKSLLPSHRVQISGVRFNSSYVEINWLKSSVGDEDIIESFTCESISNTKDYEIEIIRESHYQVPTSIKIYPELKKAEIYF